jgi:predicted hotdog family 3-hydroxylacyl-ACP dehydratase
LSGAGDEFRSLIPHAGGMCLLERVIDWDADRIRLATTTHRSMTNPLRRNGQLRAIHLCEYGAQAMAVHGGLKARAEGTVAPPGFLVALRAVKLHVARIDDLDGELTITGTCLMATPGSWQYEFTVAHAGRTIAEGRAAVIAQPGAGQTAVTAT